MEFLDEVSETDFQNIMKLDPTIPSILDHWKCHWVKVSEDDFTHNIHIITQGISSDFATWDVFDRHLCLGHYSKKVYDSNYYIGDELKEKYPSFQTQYFDKIKERVENFSREKMLCTPLCYLANERKGPYAIRESIKRHIAAYIHYFILKAEQFEQIDNNAICMIPDDGQFNSPMIPNDFCNICIK